MKLDPFSWEQPKSTELSGQVTLSKCKYTQWCSLCIGCILGFISWSSLFSGLSVRSGRMSDKYIYSFSFPSPWSGGNQNCGLGTALLHPYVCLSPGPLCAALSSTLCIPGFLWCFVPWVMPSDSILSGSCLYFVIRLVWSDLLLWCEWPLSPQRLSLCPVLLV